MKRNNLTKPIVVALFIILLMIICVPCEAGWLIYHKSEFKGKVVDAETNEPIEGAVVVVSYTKTTMGLGAGANTTDIDHRETKTDKEGNFVIPSYTTFIQPFSWESRADFIIYKPGYANIDNLGLEDAFSTRAKKTYEVLWISNFVFHTNLKFIISPGVVALPKLRTVEERKLALPVISGEMSWKKLKLLMDLHHEEERNLYK